MVLKHKNIKNIQIHINELVFDGIPYSERYAVVESIKKELQRLWNGKDIQYENMTIEKINAGSFYTKGNSNNIGQNVARKIYSSIAASKDKVKQ